MRQRVTDHVIELADRKVKDQAKIAPEYLRVAAWLRGDREKLDSLIGLLAADIEWRGSLDIPSTAHQCAINAGMDKQTRKIISTLVELYRLPVTASSNEEDNG